MIIVEPSVELEWITPRAELEIEVAGRTCYKSEDKISETSAGTFIRKLIADEHEAVLEHASASFRFIIDRGISHELVRHRLAAYCQESTRYCDYAKAGNIQVIEPPGLAICERGRDIPLCHNDCCSFHIWQGAVAFAEATYFALRGVGVLPQIARAVLPTCLKTEVVMTANMREWRHVLKLRCSLRAHPQMREVMTKVVLQLFARCPNLFFDRVPTVR